MNHIYSMKEKQLKDELQKEVPIPLVVRSKTQNAYRMIKSGQVRQTAAPKDSFHWMKTGARVAGGMAAVLALSFAFCAANPVMARELPLVGGLFERLQNEVSFFGNFADKATVLEEPEASVSADPVDSDTSAKAEADTNAAESAQAEPAEAAVPADGVYTKTCDGLTITFSEVYANSQAIYLTMLAQSEKPFPDTMMSQTENGTERPVFDLDFTNSYSFLENQSDADLYNSLQPEGVFLDDRTYSCILRLDLALATMDTSEYTAQYDAMVQGVLDEMGITMDDLNDETDEGYVLLTEFNDKVSSRGGALRSYIKNIPVPDSFTLHLDISKLIGTKADPEYWDSGYTAEELQNMSDEEWRAVMKQEPAEYLIYPNEHQNYWYQGSWSYDIPVTIDESQTVILDINETNENGIGLQSVIKTPYELTVNELYEEGSDSDCIVVALDANGNKLPYNDSNGSANNFAIQDRDISTVDIYILDYIQYMDELKGEERYNNNENKPEEEKWSTLLSANAKYHKTIHFD